MSYVEETLLKGEKVIYQGRISLWQYWHVFAIAIGAAVPSFGASLLLIIIPYINYYTSELAITDKRVIAKFGLIQRKSFEVLISKVDSIIVNQGIMGRIFNYGNLVVSNAGGNAPIPGVKDPLKFRKEVLQIQIDQK